jgi:hypothetical protein
VIIDSLKSSRLYFKKKKKKKILDSDKSIAYKPKRITPNRYNQTKTDNARTMNPLPNPEKQQNNPNHNQLLTHIAPYPNPIIQANTQKNHLGSITQIKIKKPRKKKRKEKN